MIVRQPRHSALPLGSGGRQIVAHASLLLPHCSILHRRVAEALERLHGAEAPEVADALAFHFRRAGAWAKAVHHLGRFAERAALSRRTSRPVAGTKPTAAD